MGEYDRTTLDLMTLDPLTLLYDPGPKFDIYSLYHIFTTDGLVSTQVVLCQSFLGQVEFSIFVLS